MIEFIKLWLARRRYIKYWSARPLYFGSITNLNAWNRRKIRSRLAADTHRRAIQMQKVGIDLDSVR